MVLKDKDIRAALKEHLARRKPTAEKVVDELRVQNGGAIADVVALYKEMHCYEIKGETDSVGRLTKQSSFYSLVFPKLTAVVALNHLKWAMSNLPSYWGIIVAVEKEGVVTLCYKRSAGFNPNFDKELGLMILWKDELINIASNILSIRVKSSHTRQELASIMGPMLKKNDVLGLIKNAILAR